MKKISIQFRGGLLLLCALIVFGCSRDAAVSNHPGAGGVSPATEGAQPAQNPEDKMLRVNSQDAMKAVNEGKAVIIDVRGADSYKMAHIKGALDHALARVESGDFKDLPKDKQIIAYCT